MPPHHTQSLSYSKGKSYKKVMARRAEHTGEAAEQPVLATGKPAGISRTGVRNAWAAGAAGRQQKGSKLWHQKMISASCTPRISPCCCCCCCAPAAPEPLATVPPPPIAAAAAACIGCARDMVSPERSNLSHGGQGRPDCHVHAIQVVGTIAWPPLSAAQHHPPTSSTSFVAAASTHQSTALASLDRKI